MKREKHTLTLNQQKHCDLVIALCVKAEGYNSAATKECYAHFRVLMPSIAHVKQVSRYVAIRKALRVDGKVTYALKLFYKWVKLQLDGQLPGQKTKKSKAVSPAVWENARKARMVGLDNMLRQARHGDIVSTETINALAKAITALKACDAAIARDLKENERDARVAAKAERDGIAKLA